MLIDTHAHLAMDPLYNQWREVVNDAVMVGVQAFIVPGTDICTSSRAVEMATLEPRIAASVGIHPENLSEAVDPLVVLAHQPTVSAIGEIGLDYFRFPKNEDPQLLILTQRRLFITQLDLARELDLPVLIHTRTEAAMHDVVADITSVYGTREFRGIFHCFTGSYAFFNEIAHWNIFLGVGGLITHPHQQSLQETISRIPLERMVLETDAPFLTPSPLPKGTNTPGNVTIAACKLAQLKAVSLTQVLTITGDNALRLFPQLDHL